MENERKQEMEWLESQKIEISVNLLAAAKQHLQFLGAVDRNRWLYDGPALQRAIYRYKAYWLPLLAKYTKSSSICQGPLIPPLDCEWVWHCHRLNPVRYKSDCEQFYGRILDNSGFVSSVNGNCKSQTETLWKRLYPTEPYDLDLDETITEPEDISVLEKCTTYDLVSAVKRQTSFYYQVSRAHVDNDIFLQEAVARYKAFLYLIKRNRQNSIKLFSVPTYDIDLIWHTHQLNPFFYCKDLENILGKILQHDDTDSDRSKGKKLDIGFSGVTVQWEETFGQRYWKAGAMKRGDIPKPITTSPYVSRKKPTLKENESQNVIQFSEVDVTEVMLEIVRVKNLPDAHKGKVFVLCSKSQPDSMFKAERRLNVLSESCEEKQVALFQCEPRGELCFKLMSSSKGTKTLGFGSLSLSELFLSPVTKLSVEKWLELTPSNSKGNDSNPIFLRVAVSFTPPIPSPTLLHLVEARPSLMKDSCFSRKSFTRVVDETGTEVISLQMRNSKDAAEGDRRQVIGVKESGETLILAEYDGKFWSLLDSKWSLKQTSNPETEEGPLFEISGTRMVKLYCGKKLEYKSEHCTKLTSEEDFMMTAVEFSKQYPYGKALGLFDLKLGSIEANEKWLVLPFMITVFILNTIVKTEETKKSELMIAIETQMKLEASGCGSGCGGGCGGGMMKKSIVAGGTYCRGADCSVPSCSECGPACGGGGG